MKVTKADIYAINAPSPTETWQPVSHRSVDEFVRYKLQQSGISVESAHYAASRNGNNVVGTFKLDQNVGGVLQTYHRQLLCWRNSISKQASLGITIGSQVLFCTNQMLLGDWIATHKHTRYIYEKLEPMWARVHSRMKVDMDYIEGFYTALTDVPLTRQLENDTLVRLCQGGAMSWTHIPRVLNAMTEIDNVQQSDTLGQLYNAYTYTLKGRDARYNAERTPLATQIFDRVIRENLEEESSIIPANSTAEVV